MGNYKYLVTVRFPAWGYGEEKTYPAFGVKYLLEIPADVEEISGYFLEKWEEKIGKGRKFDGEILFIEQFDCVVF